jgi:hypothetical protein
MEEIKMDTDNKQIYERYKAQCNVDWQGDRNFYHLNRYLIENLQSLKICPKCLSLYGSINIWDGQTVVQKCSCGHDTKKQWDGFDYNEAYTTCYCCGLEVINSGSRWSSFYCTSCKKMIWELNTKAVECIIPLGRHSIMNGFSLAGKDAGNRKAIDAFIKSSNSLRNRIDLVHEHKQSILQQRVKSFKLTNKSPVLDLINQTQNIDLNELKRAAFFDMLGLMINRPLNDTIRLYNSGLFFN